MTDTPTSDATPEIPYKADPKAVSEAKADKAAKTPAARKSEPAPEPAPRATSVITPGADTDEVRLSKISYKNVAAAKSLSVFHLQRRLAELGYGEAAAERQGYYGDLTAYALAAWQKDNGIDSDDAGRSVSADELAAIFKGDPNVDVRLD